MSLVQTKFKNLLLFIELKPDKTLYKALIIPVNGTKIFLELQSI